MAYWDSLKNSSAYSPYTGERPRSTAFAAQYPTYEQQTPQYTTPSPYSLAQQGYRTNTLIYACIEKRLRAIGGAPMQVFDSMADRAVINGLRAADIIKNPNDRLDERQFWQIVQMYLDISGFSCWEIERNNLGEEIKLWPMRSDWCSFLRGNGRPLRAVRYQPYGLAPQDIDIENILLFQYFDPLFPMLKGYSPTMAALRDVSVDSGMTQFLYSFIQEGARFSGLLTTEQDLDDIEAERIRQRWSDQHGGVANWNNIAVLGRGATYQNTSMSFSDMAFPELDGRTEARICMAFGISPILIGTKIGLDASTYSNYAQARRAWYEEWVTPQWELLAGQYGSQMLREYKPDGTFEINRRYVCGFNTRNVAALQENRDLAFRRAVSGVRSNLLTRDQGLREIGLDPVDGKRVYIGAAIRVGEDPTGTILSNIEGVDLTNDIEDIAEDATENKPGNDFGVDNGMFGTGIDQQFPDDLNGTAPAEALEEKQFRAFAKNRLRQGKPEDILRFDWKHTPAKRRIELVAKFLK